MAQEKSENSNFDQLKWFYFFTTNGKKLNAEQEKILLSDAFTPAQLTQLQRKGLVLTSAQYLKLKEVGVKPEVVQGVFNGILRSDELVGKIPKCIDSIGDALMSHPTRNVGLWKSINPEFGPTATFNHPQHGRGWVCPYIEGDQANGLEIYEAIISVYNKTKRVVVDALTPGNVISHPKGGVKLPIVVDLDMAIVPALGRRKSFASLQWRSYYEPLYMEYFARCNPYQTCALIKALLFMSAYFPDIENVDFFRDPILRDQVARAYESDKILNARNILKNESSTDKELVKACEWLSWLANDRYRQELSLIKFRLSEILKSEPNEVLDTTINLIKDDELKLKESALVLKNKLASEPSPLLALDELQFRMRHIDAIKQELNKVIFPERDRILFLLQDLVFIGTEIWHFNSTISALNLGDKVTADTFKKKIINFSEALPQAEVDEGIKALYRIQFRQGITPDELARVKETTIKRTIAEKEEYEFTRAQLLAQSQSSSSSSSTRVENVTNTGTAITSPPSHTANSSTISDQVSATSTGTDAKSRDSEITTTAQTKAASTRVRSVRNITSSHNAVATTSSTRTRRAAVKNRDSETTTTTQAKAASTTVRNNTVTSTFAPRTRCVSARSRVNEVTVTAQTTAASADVVGRGANKRSSSDVLSNTSPKFFRSATSSSSASSFSFETDSKTPFSTF